MRPEDGKKIYDNIEIPEELSQVVRQSIEEAGRRRSQNSKKRLLFFPGHQKAARAVAAAAGVLIVFTAGLNTSQAFAETMKQVPGLGILADVLTIRSYHESDGDVNINAEVPGIIKEESQPENQSGTVRSVNEQIQKIVDDYMEQGKREFEEYKKAYFATGGTKEGWGDRQMDISTHYDVKNQSEELLSLELVTIKGWVNAEENRYYYNLNLKEDRELSLKDVMGSDYVDFCNKEIVKQIKERMATDENQVFFGFEKDDDGMVEGFTTVDETTDFYINENNEVVLVFPKYSIAPGYMGITEFNMGKMKER